MPFARLNEVELYYEVHGEGDPILLIPGLGSDANTWATLIPDLPNYRLIAIENRGAGRSTKPQSGYSTEQMSQDVAGLVEQLGIQRAHVIGKSMGGMIAQILAVRYPQRVRSLVLASSALKHDYYGEQLLELGRLVAEKAGLFATFKLAFLLSYSREYCSRNQSRLAEVEALLKRFDPDEVLRGYCGQSIACQNHDSSAIAHKIQVPTLVITGQDDWITPAEGARELAAAIPDAQLVILPRGGHGVWREFPEDVNPIVTSFLKSVT